MTGFGNKNLIDQIRIIADETEVTFNVKRKFYFALYYQAIEELNFHSNIDSFRIPNHSLLKRVKKILALAVHTKHPLAGLVNGLKISFEIKNVKNLNLEILNFDISAARSIGRHGISIPNYEESLEYDFRRKSRKSGLHFSNLYFVHAKSNFRDARILTRFISQEIDRISICKDLSVAKMICESYLPSWHNASRYFSLKFNDPSQFKIVEFAKIAINSEDLFFLQEKLNKRFSTKLYDFYSARDVKIYSGKQLVVGEILVETGYSESLQSRPRARWPHLVWTSSDSSFAVFPKSVEGVKLHKVIYGEVSSNWAHFIEDNLPPLIQLAQSSSHERLIYSGLLDPAKFDILAYLFGDQVSVLNPLRRYKCDELSFATFDNRRSLAINGSCSGSEIVELPLLRKFISGLSAASNAASPRRIYLPRAEGGFRRMSNQKDVIKYLQSEGFQTLEISKIGFQERMNLFANVDVLVCESGAGTVNGYFLKSNAIVIELCHPDLFDTRENESIESFGSLHWIKIKGLESSTRLKFKYGPDSFSTPVTLISEKLKEINN